MLQLWPWQTYSFKWAWLSPVSIPNTMHVTVIKCYRQTLYSKGVGEYLNIAFVCTQQDFIVHAAAAQLTTRIFSESITESKLERRNVYLCWLGVGWRSKMMCCAVNVLCNCLFLKVTRLSHSWCHWISWTKINCFCTTRMRVNHPQNVDQKCISRQWPSSATRKMTLAVARAKGAASAKQQWVGMNITWGRGRRKWGYCCIFVEIGPGPKNIPIYSILRLLWSVQCNLYFINLFLPSRTSIVELLLVLLVLVDCRLPFRRTINS